tara:strand:+ start:1215 stop:2111 length:897 start_codon:yes stop_codon:yes gene_type:complete
MALLDNQTQAQYYGNSDNFGKYQFTSLQDVINQFMIAYVGEGKIITKAKRPEIAFHAQRALQELSFDTLKSIKSHEIEIPNVLQMVLPQDYVNYVKLSYCDDAGIEHVLYPARQTSNPTAPEQDGSISINNFDDSDADGNIDLQTESNTWEKYKKSGTATSNVSSFSYDSDRYDFLNGQRFGIDAQYAQSNGSFYIDDLKGLIHFSSNLSGKTVTLKYISDSLGTEGEMQIHKMAEEAMYKHISYAILSTASKIPEYIVQRARKEKIASTRKAKLRLSNIKLEEITQILRGSSKHIKH